jgi:hypothetical protein
MAFGEKAVEAELLRRNWVTANINTSIKNRPTTIYLQPSEIVFSKYASKRVLPVSICNLGAVGAKK